MKRRRILGLGLACAAWAGAGHWRAAGARTRGTAHAVAGDAAATRDALAKVYGLELPAPDGTPRRLADFRGKPLVLNFWATWCAPCVKEMPDLDSLAKKHANVHVVGIAVDTAANVVRFGERVPVSYPLVVAGHGGIRLMKDLGNPRGGLPFTLVVDSDGNPVAEFLGQIARDDLDRVLDGFSA